MGDPAIEVESLGKRFGDITALESVDLSVAAGSVVGLLGPNGAGKTTIVRILTTILRPDSGRATILGLDVVRHAKDVRSVIGLAGQFAAVDGTLTGRENLRLMSKLTQQPRRVIGPRVDELLEDFDLQQAADRPTRTYSGGMRRRLDLAAALVHRPRVLFLDEPTTGLDPRSRNALWVVIRELVADGTTLLLTTQYLEEADQLADRIVVIDHGRIIAEGTAGELKAKFGSTVVEIRFADGERAQTALERLATVGFGHLVNDGRTVALGVSDSGSSLLAVLRVMDGNNLVPESLAVREPSLDDVFLDITGRHAEPSVSSGDVP